MSPEDRERILSRSTEMLKLAKDVLHELRHDGEEPTYGEEPSIPELAAIAQLITNMGAVGLFREKLAERTPTAPTPPPPAPPPAAPPAPPAPLTLSPEEIKMAVETAMDQITPEVGKIILEKASEEIHQMLKERIEGIFPELVMNTTANAAQNIDHLVDEKIQQALQMIDAKIAEALHQRGFQ
jgi:hypothetical protein